MTSDENPATREEGRGRAASIITLHLLRERERERERERCNTAEKSLPTGVITTTPLDDHSSLPKTLKMGEEMHSHALGPSCSLLHRVGWIPNEPEEIPSRDNDDDDDDGDDETSRANNVIRSPRQGRPLRPTRPRRPDASTFRPKENPSQSVSCLVGVASSDGGQDGTHFVARC
jgi:hypothetical protein